MVLARLNCMFIFQKTKFLSLGILKALFAGFFVSLVVTSVSKAEGCDLVLASSLKKHIAGERLPSEVEQMVRELFPSQITDEYSVADEVTKKIADPFRSWEDLEFSSLGEEVEKRFKVAQGNYENNLLSIVERRKLREISDNDSRTLIQEAYLQFFDETRLSWHNMGRTDHVLVDGVMADPYKDALNFVANHKNGLSFWQSTLVDPDLSVVGKKIDPNKAEYGAIQKYTANSDKFNRPLRDGRKPFWRTSALKKLLRRMSPYEGVVYRNVGHIVDERIRNEFLTPGNIVSDKGFMSTSRAYMPVHLSASSAGETSLTIIIRSRTGRSVEELSHFRAREKEVLFLPGVKFEVVMVQEGPHSSYTVYLNELEGQ